jgi:uncharacterized protein YeaO (DUF488 family)
MKQITLYTAQLGKWRLIRELGIHLLDITAKTGKSAFAPHWSDLMAYKRDEIDWEEYERRYRLRMQESEQEYPDEWAMLLQLPERVALVCYCAPGQKCHRYVFREILVEYYKRHDVAAGGGREIVSYLSDDNNKPQELKDVFEG